jgi:hydroxyacylglutathione hydrolase
MMHQPAEETADGGLVIRRIPVGPLSTNCYLLVDAATREAVAIDPGDEPQRVIDAAHDVTVTRIILTHAHWDHVLALPEVTDHWGCPVHLHPADAPVWPHETAYFAEHGHFDAGTATAGLLACGCTPTPDPNRQMWDGHALPVGHGDAFHVGDITLDVVHTPGHTPGGITVVTGSSAFTGDTLFPGGPGLTGWPFSDFDTIIDSIRRRLFTLGGATIVHPGHGAPTTIGQERPHLAEWTARGW